MGTSEIMLGQPCDGLASRQGEAGRRGAPIRSMLQNLG